MRIGVTTKGLEAVGNALRAVAGPGFKAATAKALNDTAFVVRSALQAEVNSVFDRPTAFITKSPKVFMATPEKLSATVAPTMHTANSWVRGGKIGVDPQDVLQAQEFGGTRRDKKSEVALRRAGFLPAGYQTAIPKTPFPGSDDGRGNLKGTFLQQVLSFLQLYGEQGYKANMKKAARDKLKKYGKSNITKRAQQQPGPRMGRNFFIAGSRQESRFEGGEHKIGPVGIKGTGHLQPGIWAVINGKQLRPVLIFVKTPTYTPRLSMARVAKAADAENYLSKQIRHRIYKLLGT